MNTLFINGSPKKSLSVSGYLAFVQRIFVRGKAVREPLRNRTDNKRILGKLKDADAVVFCLPLFVDSVPSHVLAFMKEMETYCKENKLNARVYVISNGGFIEGRQNRPLMLVFENFCASSGLVWGGGIGIGGGVMLNVMRILFFVFAGIFLLNILLSGVSQGIWLPESAIRTFLIQTLEILFFNLGVLVCMIRLGFIIGNGKTTKPMYTRILLPSFLFILIADVFFSIISVFKGGIFRGWFSRK